jgi:hypothetical protein
MNAADLIKSPNSTYPLVNRTTADTRPFHDEFMEAYRNGGVLSEELADMFKLTILKEYNLDGTDRMLIDFA